MKRLLLFVFAVFAFAACTQDAIEEASRPVFDEAPEFLTVGFEGNDTRIELNALQKTVWTEGDFVSVFYRSDSNRKWQYQGVTGERTGDLKQVYDPNNASKQHNKTIVVYPYSEDYWLNTESYSLEAMLPTTQHYHEGSYGVGDNLMVAQSEFTQFTLKSVCGWIKIQLTGDGEVVKSVTVRGNDGEQVAGLVYVNTESAALTLAAECGEADDNGNVGGNLVFDDAIFRSVTLDCGEGVVLSEDATTFYIALPPQTFAKGVTVKVECDNYMPMTLSRTESLTIKRNHIQPMAVVEHDAQEVIPNNEIHYTATEKVEPYKTGVDIFGANIVSHTFDSTTGKGAITFDGDVTTIGDGAFYNCGSLTSVTMPNSVTTIGHSAFNDCDNLLNVILSENLTEIGNYVFCYCYELNDITLPNSLIKIGERAFAYCRELESITLPDGLTTIGTYAFRDCDSLVSVTIPNSVTELGESAFSCCDNLVEFKGKYAADGGRCLIYNNIFISFANGCGVTDYNIPAGIIRVGRYAFSGCHSLNSVVIPNSVKVIEGWAFAYCRKLESITLPDGLTTIGTYAFRDCDSLVSVTIPNSVTELANGVFTDCNNLVEFKGKYAADGGRCLIDNNTLKAFAVGCGVTEYTIPAGITVVYDCAFEGCNSLISVTIPEGVTKINYDAFYNCDNLLSVIIPESVDYIGDYAFGSCDILESVYCYATTPPTLNGTCVFDINAANRKIYVPAESVAAYKSAQYWSEYAESIVAYVKPTPNNIIYYTATEMVKPSATGVDIFGANIVSHTFDSATGEGAITFDGDVTMIGDRAFYECDKLTGITIPNSVTRIGDRAFTDCKHLQGITIPEGVTIVENFAFYYCYNLKSCTLPQSLIEIGEYAFDGCSKLESITFPDGLEKIGREAFCCCTSLTSVTIPNSVVDVGAGAFGACDNLEEFKGKYAADGGRCMIKDNAIISFAEGCGVTDYTIPAGVTIIGYYAFYRSDSLISVTIPYGVTKVDSMAFYGCDNLRSVVLPDGLTSIGSQAFDYCRNLDNIILPNSLITIGSIAFHRCDSLSSVTIPNSVTELASGAFAGCNNLVEFKGKFVADGGRCLIDNNTLKAFAAGCGVADYAIPNGVTIVGKDSFEFSDGLISVTIPDGVTKVEQSAFLGCDNLQSVILPESITYIGLQAFDYCYKLESVYCYATTPPTLYFDLTFDHNAANRKIYVPAESVAAYKSAQYWSEYAESIVAMEKPKENNKIYYTASAYMFKYEVDAKFGDLMVVAHDYNAETGEGVITFSGPVTKIPGSAFAKMSLISSITIPDSVVEIEGYAFSYCSASSINIPDGVRTIGQYAFEQTDITSVVIPDGVTKIDTYVFRACTCLESVTIPSSVESIEWEAFNGCEKLDNLVIPGNVKSVGWAAFSSCSSLKNLTISEGVQEIYANAFNGCGSLESVVIPSTVTSIGSMAFQYCYKLEKVYCKPTIPPGAGDNMFYNADPLTIYVPYDSLSNYKETYNWSTYKNRMVGCDFSDI